MTLLPEDFFARATIEVARDLLGATLRVRSSDGLWTAGRIVETEAYGGAEDPASHAAGGRTPRSEIMFGPPGLAYVYLIYGMHHCLNFVTEPDGQPGAVLIRALEPVEGQSVMARRRNQDPDRPRLRSLCNGPGNLCQSLAIDLTWNAIPTYPCPEQPSSVNQRLLTLAEAHTPVPHQATPRIGLTKAKDLPHRFIIPQNNFLTR